MPTNTAATATTHPATNTNRLYFAPPCRDWVSYFSDDPVRDADRYHSARATEQDQRRSQEAMLVNDFIQAVRASQLQAPAPFAPHITDYSRGAGHAFKRHPTVAEVLTDALDYPSGPSYDDVLGFVAKAANTGNAEALSLIGRMAATWASHNAGLA